MRRELRRPNHQSYHQCFNGNLDLVKCILQAWDRTLPSKLTVPTSLLIFGTLYTFALAICGVTAGFLKLEWNVASAACLLAAHAWHKPGWALWCRIKTKGHEDLVASTFVCDSVDWIMVIPEEALLLEFLTKPLRIASIIAWKS